MGMASVILVQTGTLTVWVALKISPVIIQLHISTEAMQVPVDRSYLSQACIDSTKRSGTYIVDSNRIILTVDPKRSFDPR